jgi:methylenetetrahydrofolate reductase (NADPH)
MKIRDILSQKKTVFSFEFFPPKTEADVPALFQTLSDLKRFHPDFVSVTWGAGGSTHRQTIDIVGQIKKDHGIEPLAHLTCVGVNRDQIQKILQEIHSKDIENILALRGDPPLGQSSFLAPENGYSHAVDLVKHIKSFRDFSVGVAGYPEKHPEAKNMAEDIDYLKMKVDAGADFVTTQLFFDNKDYFNFCDSALQKGITIPILPGIMPITNLNQIKKFTTMCGAKIPDQITSALEKLKDDKEAVVKYGIEYATKQCQELLRNGAHGIHFYTLNRSTSVKNIIQNLNY